MLDPLFFILYINDVQAAINESNIQLTESGKSANEIAAKLQPALSKFSKWCHANKLSLNASKTKLMAFGMRQKVKKSKSKWKEQPYS